MNACVSASPVYQCALLRLPLPLPLPLEQQVIVTCMRQTADHQERMVEQIRYSLSSLTLHSHPSYVSHTPVQCSVARLMSTLCMQSIEELVMAITCFSAACCPHLYIILPPCCESSSVCLSVCVPVARVSWSPCRLCSMRTV